MEEGDKVNVRSPQQQNEAHNPSSATSSSKSVVTIHQSTTKNPPTNPLVWVVIVVLIAVIAYLLGSRFPEFGQRILSELLSTPTATAIEDFNTSTEDVPVPTIESATNVPTSNTPQPMAVADTPVPTVTPTMAPKPITGGDPKPGERDRSTSPPENLVDANDIFVCIPPWVLGHKTTIHFWRLAADERTWEQDEYMKRSISRIDVPATSRAKIDGVKVDLSYWGDAGQPYHLELWVDGTPKAAIGSKTIDQQIIRVYDQKEFRVHREWDNTAPDTFCELEQP